MCGMPRELEDSVVVITGASSGIGRATAHALAEHGASVVLAARSEQSLREVVIGLIDGFGVLGDDVSHYSASLEEF